MTANKLIGRIAGAFLASTLAGTAMAQDAAPAAPVVERVHPPTRQSCLDDLNSAAIGMDTYIYGRTGTGLFFQKFGYILPPPGVEDILATRQYTGCVYGNQTDADPRVINHLDLTSPPQFQRFNELLITAQARDAMQKNRLSHPHH